MIVTEDSWFVVNSKDDSNFISTIVKLGGMYCQDSIAILEKGGKNSYLIGTNNSEFPGYGEKITFGNIWHIIFILSGLYINYLILL